MLSRGSTALRVVSTRARFLSTKPSVAVLGTGPVAAAAKTAVAQWATVTDSPSAPFVLAIDADAGAVKADAVVAVSGCTAAAKLAAAKPGATVVAITSAPAVAAAAELASAAGVAPSEVSNVISWGTGFADVSHATVGGKWALTITDTALPAVTPTPEAEAEAAASTIKALALGTGGEWISMGVPAVGDYGTGTGIFYSVPVVCESGAYKRVGGVSLTPEVAEAMEKSRLELAK